MRPKNGGGEQPYHLLEEAKQLAKDNLLKQAHEKLEQVITLTENDADLEDVHDAAIAERGRLPVRAADVIEQVRGQIDELLALMPDLDEVTHAEITTHGEDFTDEWYTLVEEYMRDWRQEIEGYLSRWEDAILGDSDRDYNRMQQRVEARARELQRELFIGGVRAEVHQRWETVDDMIERGERIAPSTVVNYYGQARDAVRKALDYYPDKPELDVLRDRAEQLRDQKALGAQVYTSAVQGEYYAKALQDLEGLPPDEEVPRYVFVEDTQSGQLVERFDAYITREEAQRDLEERAADWAREKATEYLNNAERYLNEHHPNRALDELKGRSKLERFLESDYKKDFDETEEKVNAELEKYKEANAVAEKVTEHLNNPLVAWSVYEDARNIYEWADGVATARETVIAKISSDLQRILDEARQAYEARNISTVGQLSQEAKEKYQDKDIAIIQGLLDEIDVVQRQADTFRDQLAAAEEMLDGIDTVLDDDPGLATSKLRELKNTFDSDVLDQLERLHDIETRVSERGSAEDKLENLKGFLTSESISRVKGAIGQARTDKNRYSHDERFENIQRDLELHLEYLEAERSFQTNQYMDALPHFEHVSAQRDHPDADDASNRVREIRQMIEREESINTELNSLENMLSEDPATAYFAAIELDIADQQQLKRRNALAEKAKRHARTRAEAVLSEKQSETQAWDNAEDLDVFAADETAKTIERQIQLLKNLGYTNLADEWDDRLGAALAAQRARRLESNPDTSEENFENIQGAWKEAIALAAGGQRDSYERELKRVRKDAAQFMLKKAQSAASLSNADTDETQELIEHVRRQLQSLAEQYGNDVQVVLWQAELAKVGGQYSYRPNRRREYFQSMESLAQNAQQRASNRHEKDQAARLLKESREGKNVAQKMDEIQSDFHQNSPKSLRNARQKWDEIRQDYGDLAVLQNWWDSLTRNKIAEIKRGINEDAPQISVHELRPIAMVAMLNPDYELGRDMLNNLGDHWSNLSEEVEQVINNATKAEGIQGDTGKAILNQQQKEIQQMLRNLEMMSYLPDLFPARNDISHIPSEAKEKLAALEKEHDDLKSLEQDINTISMTFQTDKKLGDLSETRNALDQVMRKYTRDNHAAYRLLFQQYRDANRRLNELRQVTESVRTAVKDENYDRAWSELNKTSQSNLSEYGLDETFEIVEPKRGDLLVGYDQILETVRKRRGAIRDVMAFAVLVDLQGENDIPTLDIHSEQYDDLLRKRARSAVNWPRQRDIATRNVHKGQFEAAKQVIREAIGGPIDSKTLPLEEVIAYLEAPPYVEAVTEEEKQAAVTPMQRYTLAIEKAGTVAGAELLMHLRDEVLPAYEQQLAEAEAMLTEDSTAASDENIYFAEQKFEQSWEQWQQSVDSIGTAMSSPHLKAGGRKPDKDSLRQIAETIYKAYVDCEETCADHPRLEEMRELWIWKEIARLMDMSHPTGGATNGFEEL